MNPNTVMHTVLIRPTVHDTEDFTLGVWLPPLAAPLGISWDSRHGGVHMNVWCPSHCLARPTEMYVLAAVPDLNLHRLPSSVLGLTYIGAAAVPDAGYWNFFFGSARGCDGNLLACNDPKRWSIEHASA